MQMFGPDISVWASPNEAGADRNFQQAPRSSQLHASCCIRCCLLHARFSYVSMFALRQQPVPKWFHGDCEDVSGYMSLLSLWKSDSPVTGWI